MTNESNYVPVPKVSVCIITYNHANYVADCLESILAQEADFQIEVVISDDCSTDNTQAIIRDYGARYPNIIRPILRERNAGPTANLYDAIAHCRGEFIAFCEGDDYWLDKRKLERQVRQLEAHGEKVNLSFHAALKVTEAKRSISEICVYSSTRFTASEVIRAGGGFMPTASLVIRRRALEQLPVWLTDMPIGDYFIQAIAAAGGGALYLPQVMSAYRWKSSSSLVAKDRDVSRRWHYCIKMLQGLENLDKHLGRQYHTEIAIRRRRLVSWNARFFFIRLRWGKALSLFRLAYHTYKPL